VHLLLSGPFARSITRSYPFRMLRAHTRQQGPSARLQITSDQSPGLLLGEFPDATTQAVAQVLKTYFDGINSADYEQAWLMLSPRLRGPSWSSFAKGTSTS
jgi:hypothetical protein